MIQPPPVERKIIMDDNIIKFIKDIKPFAAKILHTLPDNLYITQYINPTINKKTNVEYCIKELKNELLPFICRGNRKHSNYNSNIGVFLYETKNKPSIKYILINYPIFTHSSIHIESFKILRKGDLYRLQRFYKKQATKNYVCEPPILPENLKENIYRETIGFVKNFKLIEKYGLKGRRGLLFYGPPGNGKTSALRWIISEANKHNISTKILTSSAITNAYDGTELEQIMNEATITIFDDVNIELFNRNNKNDNVACDLLTALDGIVINEHRVIIFATNEDIKDLDKAFIRPGRIDLFFKLDKPTQDLRKQLMNTWKDVEIDKNKAAEITKDFSFADLEFLRSILINNFLFKAAGWSLDGALEDFYKDRQIEKGKLGW